MLDYIRCKQTSVNNVYGWQDYSCKVQILTRILNSLKWAQQSHKSNGRDIKIKDTNKCEAFGAVGEFKGI